METNDSNPVWVDALGDSGPWIRLVPHAWHAVARGHGAVPIPRGEPVFTERHEESISPNDDRTAFWAPALHLMLRGLGWTDPVAGLVRWREQMAFEPGADPVLGVLRTWYSGKRLDELLAWSLMSGAISAVTASADDRLAVDLKMVREVLDGTVDAAWLKVWRGGTDPMHLTSHVDWIVHAGKNAAAHVSRHGDRVCVRYTSYRELPLPFRALPQDTDDRGVDVVDVECALIGRLGTFRRSATTALWHCATEEAHQWGQGGDVRVVAASTTVPMNKKGSDTWDGTERRLPKAVAQADAARRGDWEQVLKFSRETEMGPNTWRPGGKSRFTSLHQAAWHNAPIEVVEELLDLGAWRTLRTTEGRTAYDIARSKGHTRLLPHLVPTADPFGAKMRLLLDEQLKTLVDSQIRPHITTALLYPQTSVLNELTDTLWFPVPGMYGGFKIAPASEGLEVASWSRVVEGSGQEHLVTPDGSTRIDEGYV
ncbi:hypothetical protein ACFT2C_07660 [Promicromonospora sp. NPDC057138]|uniref:hypothetical protein n=1 Tax=Promicromonospora sp. NPDC057138 TaxID=3346031 RepID=UPI00363C8FB7